MTASAMILNVSFSSYYQYCTFIFLVDKCRKCVIENDGLKVITSTVKQAIALGNTEQAAELRSYSVGLLLNLVAGNEDVDLNVSSMHSISSTILIILIKFRMCEIH